MPLFARVFSKSSSIVVVAEGDKSGKNVFEIASYIEKHSTPFEPFCLYTHLIDEGYSKNIRGHLINGGKVFSLDEASSSICVKYGSY